MAWIKKKPDRELVLKIKDAIQAVLKDVGSRSSKLKFTRELVGTVIKRL